MATTKELLDMAIKNEQAKEYYGCYLIYPHRFMNSFVLDSLLASMQKNYKLYKIMDCIKAIPM